MPDDGEENGYQVLYDNCVSASAELRRRGWPRDMIRSRIERRIASAINPRETAAKDVAEIYWLAYLGIEVGTTGTEPPDPSLN